MTSLTNGHALRAVPTEDRAWLYAALADALDGGAPVLPVGADMSPETMTVLRRQELPPGTAVVIHTTGSSGVPKAVALSARALRANAQASITAFGGAGGSLVAVPCHLVAGLQVLVRSIISGIDPVFHDGSFTPARIFEDIERINGSRRYMSLVPVQLSRLLDLAEHDPQAANTLRSLDAVLVGGQAVSLTLRRRSHRLGIALKRSYGMTETSGGCVYDGEVIGDTSLRIRDGEIQVSGASLALGYVGDKELSDQRFIAHQHSDGSTTRWYRTGDSGYLSGGMLTVTGRLDRVFVSGGVNVSLDEIERVVQELPGWHSALAFAVPHPEWGHRAVLVVETVPGAAHVDRVRSVICEQLGPAATPEWVRHVEQIERFANGKPRLQRIEAWVNAMSQKGE